MSKNPPALKLRWAGLNYTITNIIHQSAEIKVIIYVHCEKQGNFEGKYYIDSCKISKKGSYG
jgi:hypothetical protein